LPSLPRFLFITHHSYSLVLSLFSLSRFHRRCQSLTVATTPTPFHHYCHSFPSLSLSFCLSLLSSFALVFFLHIALSLSAESVQGNRRVGE
jgi:hypothetical protein